MSVPVVLFVPVIVMFFAEIKPEDLVPQILPVLAELPVMITLPVLAVTVPEKSMADPLLDCPVNNTLPAVAMSEPLPVKPVLVPLIPLIDTSPVVAVRAEVVLNAFEPLETPLMRMPFAPVIALLMLMPSVATALDMFAVVMYPLVGVPPTPLVPP